MVSALDSGASGPGTSPGRVIVLFLGKTLNSHSASLHRDKLRPDGLLGLNADLQGKWYQRRLETPKCPPPLLPWV